MAGDSISALKQSSIILRVTVTGVNSDGNISFLTYCLQSSTSRQCDLNLIGLVLFVDHNNAVNKRLRVEVQQKPGFKGKSLKQCEQQQWITKL